MYYDDLFHKNYRILIKFKRKFGTTNIPSRPGKKWFDAVKDKEYIELKTIGRFVETLRYQHKKDELSKYKIDMLNHIGFDWTAPSIKKNYELWKSNIKKLENFKKQYGHCNVPEKWKEDIKLADFVVNCRISYKKGKLRTFKIEVLNEIGFEWSLENRKRKRDHKGRYLSDLKHK